jgi:hypothetical protein
VGAYLNGELKEQIYMKQIPGYEDGSDLALLFQDTLYGLQQSGCVYGAFIQFSAINVSILGTSGTMLS